MNTFSHSWTLYEQALKSLSEGEATLDAPTLVLRLRKSFPEGDVRELNLAVETFIARHHAPQKLGEWASAGHFPLSLLQQASRRSIAEYRAEFFRGRKHVLEIGTGTGSDTAALARVATHITTIDEDTIASDLAQKNLALQGITNVTFLTASAHELNPNVYATCDALFADPMRRSKVGERVKDSEAYSPPLSLLLSLEVGSLRAIKVSPGLFVEPCPQGWVRQFVGYGEECLEQTLWYGSPLVDSSIAVTDCAKSWAPVHTEATTELTNELAGYIVEAHATINRSQYLDLFFHEHGIKLFARDVAYGISPVAPHRSELLTSYRILEHLPYAKKTLKSALSRLGWSNRTELKKRNFTGDLESIRAELALPKHSHTAPFGTVFFFRYHGKPWTLLAERHYE